ncbi:putative cyclin domain-containing protein [Dioscorea sansibarensis]
MDMDLLSTTSTLYCAEDADDLASWDSDDWATPKSLAATDDEDPTPALIAAEQAFMPSLDYLHSIHPTARHDAVSWILKVHEFYRFRPVTASLAVNYLDRFLSSHSLPDVQGQSGKGSGAGDWPMQLLSVACLSVAAKMEETHVPLLVDLQILDPRYVFEPRTVRRMELLLMAALHWRMRSVTPFDFLEPLSSLFNAAYRRPLLSRAAVLVLKTHRVVDFLGFRPSVIASSAIFSAARELAVDDADLLNSLGDSFSKEMVGVCVQLMDEYLIDTCPSAQSRKPWLEPSAPPSPIGVLDAAACGSCDTNRSLPSAAVAEPPIKRRRLGDSHCTASIDTGDDGVGISPV